MYKIQCNKLFKKEGVTRKAYVSNHPTPGTNASFTPVEAEAHILADSVTILKL